MRVKPTSVSQYLAGVRPEQRAVLEKLRKTIQSIVPKAEECISYGLPAFRLNGKPLVGYGAAMNHCAFFPMSRNTVADHQDDLKNYETSKGTIRFQPDKPLPVALLRKLVRARMAENQGRGQSRKPRQTKRIAQSKMARNSSPINARRSKTR